MTVIRLLRRDDLRQHRDAINAWLRSNLIDPDDVYDRWISVERDDGPTFIQYRRIKRDPAGRPIAHPDHDHVEPWTEVTAALLIKELPDLSVTKSHDHPGG